MLAYSIVDSNGYVPQRSLIDTTWRNTKRNVMYRIIGFTWDADADIWKIEYIPADRSDMISRTRSVTGWFGKNSNGEPRFEYVC